MDYLNNMIPESRSTFVPKSKDYIEQYLLDYFDIQTLIQLPIVVNNIAINTTFDLLIKYKNLFQLLPDKPNLESGFVQLERIQGRESPFKYIHPKNIYHLNLWRYINTNQFINQFESRHQALLNQLKPFVSDVHYRYSFKPYIDFIEAFY